MYILYNAAMPSPEPDDLVARERAIDALLARSDPHGMGVCWSAMTQPPPPPRTEAQRRAAALAKARRQAEWTRSPAGAFIGAIADLQRTCELALNLGEQARSAAVRGDALCGCEPLTRQIAEHLTAALRQARHLTRLAGS